MASYFGFLFALLWNEKLAFLSQHLAQVSFCDEYGKCHFLNTVVNYDKR